MSVWFHQALAGAGDLVRYVVRTGRWWMPIGLLALVIAIALAAAAQTAAPTAVYTLF